MTLLSLGLVWGGVHAYSADAQTSGAKAGASKSSKAKSGGAKSAKPVQPAEDAPLDEVDPDQAVSPTVIDVAAWVLASNDNRGLPFAVVDKEAAQVLVFGADGKLRGLAPALIGSAVGDESEPGVGDRELKDIPQDARTTPAGRFLAGYGPASGGERVLWVDYATAVSIHPLATTRAAKAEKRKERLASPETDDNRITHGCINVSATFYSKVVATTFTKKGGVFYVLPETKSLQVAFPEFQPMEQVASSLGIRAGE